MGSVPSGVVFPYYIFCEVVIIVCLQLYSAFLRQYIFSGLSVPFFLTLRIDACYAAGFICCLLAGFLGCFLLLHFTNCITQKHFSFVCLKHFDILNYLEEIHKSSFNRGYFFVVVCFVLFLKQNAFHKCYLIIVRNLN